MRYFLWALFLAAVTYLIAGKSWYTTTAEMRAGVLAYGASIGIALAFATAVPTESSPLKRGLLSLGWVTLATCFYYAVFRKVSLGSDLNLIFTGAIFAAIPPLILAVRTIGKPRPRTGFSR
jgi:hypothetical protein